MVKFICDWLTENNIPFYVDEFHNIYATKKTDEVSFFPCVISHTDTVHNIETINVVEEMLPDAQGNVKLSFENGTFITYNLGIHNPEDNMFTDKIIKK